MQIPDAEFLEIVDPALDALQVAGEPFGVGGVAQQVFVLEPGGIQRALQVQATELWIAIAMGRGRQPDQLPQQTVDLVRLVHRGQPVVQVVPPTIQPQPEQLAPMIGLIGQFLVGQGTNIGGSGWHGEIVHQARRTCRRGRHGPPRHPVQRGR